MISIKRTRMYKQFKIIDNKIKHYLTYFIAKTLSIVIGETI